MKKIIASFYLFFLSQIVTGQINPDLVSHADETFYTTDGQLSFIRLRENYQVSEAETETFINTMILNNGINKVLFQKSERDELGYTHTRFHILQNGILLAGKVIIAHSLRGKLISLNGDLNAVKAATNKFLLSESSALNYALKKVAARKYKWDNKAEERHMREALNDPGFTYYPNATKVIFEKDGLSFSAYRFNIYAEEPLYRANVFVDAASGKILDEQNLICHADVPATVATKYSGTQTITCDQNGAIYRLREVQRGLGIETYNMANTMTYTATDFTNATTSWTAVNFDQGARDAHWGAEMTYDYYLSQHNRNSINNNGFKLLSYVHYQTAFANAFWDGQRMTYGDGNGGSLKIFTALDVCGHEITHGLTSHTGNLAYSNESGALNESFSDIFGTAIENYARPGNWNWKIGEDITSSGNGLRSMSNPNAYGDPDTYTGTNYYTGSADNGGVHTNSGVGNYWFYLLTTGGSGTNDFSNAYSVTGLGITNAAKIAFRALTVYFTPTTNFATARNLTIQAAKDLFGICSNEVIQTTKAWYAVGVGADYIPGFVGPNFNANLSSFCSAPANVNFTNTTANGLSYTWYFGDGATATTTNAAHSYTAPGIYTVKLKATGCLSAIDSVVKNSYIIISPPVSSPIAIGALGCANTPLTLNAGGSGAIKWYNSPSGPTAVALGNSFVTPSLNLTTTYYAANVLTIAPVSGGMPSNTGGGYVNSGTQTMYFDVVSSGTLNSVVVYAQTPGNRTIQMRSAVNVILNSTTANLSVGPNTVTLNYNLNPGTNYQLCLSSTSPVGLYRSTTGVTYPYNIGSCVNITSSNAGTSTYYWFYNWKVTKAGCESPRVPVTATINPLPLVSVTSDTPALCYTESVNLTGTPAGGNFSGSAVSGSVFNPSLMGAGNYTVIYTYTDANGCSSSSSTNLTVQECTGITGQELEKNPIVVYPNPAKESITIRTGFSGSDLNVTISDATGRIVAFKNIGPADQTIGLHDLSKGLYLLTLRDPSGMSLKAVQFVKE